MGGPLVDQLAEADEATAPCFPTLLLSPSWRGQVELRGSGSRRFCLAGTPLRKRAFFNSLYVLVFQSQGKEPCRVVFSGIYSPSLAYDSYYHPPLEGRKIVPRPYDSTL